MLNSNGTNLTLSKNGHSQQCVEHYQPVQVVLYVHGTWHNTSYRQKGRVVYSNVISSIPIRREAKTIKKTALCKNLTRPLHDIIAAKLL